MPSILDPANDCDNLVGTNPHLDIDPIFTPEAFGGEPLTICHPPEDEWEDYEYDGRNDTPDEPREMGHDWTDLQWAYYHLVEVQREQDEADLYSYNSYNYEIRIIKGNIKRMEAAGVEYLRDLPEEPTPPKEEPKDEEPFQWF